MNRNYNFKICVKKSNNIGIIRDDKPVFRIIKKDPKIIIPSPKVIVKLNNEEVE